MITPAQRLATAADIPPEWIEQVATVLAREGQAYDLSADARSIYVQIINTGEWMPLNLPTNGHLFDTPEACRQTYTAIAAAITSMQIGTTPKITQPGRSAPLAGRGSDRA